MDINLLFKIAAIGILVAVLHQVLVRSYDDNIGWSCYSIINGYKRNKFFV